MSSLEQKPTSATIEALTSIWQRVLQLPSVGLEDNFFDLGGDSASALELFNAVGQSFGRELPPVTIYQAPTIAALVGLLEQPSTSKFPPAVLLKPGAEAPPVFLTHGLGGTVIDFYQVVRHVDTRHPIYGMQARGIDGADAPFETIEDMAQYCLDAIREVQAHGPYLLVGYSLGGLVTLEMAQRLTAEGEQVALLALLDAYPHVQQLTRWQRARFGWQKARRQISEIARLPPPQALYVLTHPAERKSLIPGDAYQALADAPLSPAMRQMRECAYRALRRYRRRYYPGKIRFVKAEVVTCFPENPAAIWKSFADQVEVEAVPGDHLGIMTTRAPDLAAVLSRYIKEAFRSE